jgi:hypothetical protein
MQYRGRGRDLKVLSSHSGRRFAGWRILNDRASSMSAVAGDFDIPFAGVPTVLRTERFTFRYGANAGRMCTFNTSILCHMVLPWILRDGFASGSTYAPEVTAM